MTHTTGVRVTADHDDFEPLVPQVRELMQAYPWQPGVIFAWADIVEPDEVRLSVYYWAIDSKTLEIVITENTFQTFHPSGPVCPTIFSMYERGEPISPVPNPYVTQEEAYIWLQEAYGVNP